MKLVIEDEAGTRSIVPFTGDEIVVGRAVEDVTFRLEERNVSRRHARFVRQNGVTWVEDLGSLTGTRVNGERITARRKLRVGDLVQIGDYDLAVMGEAAAAAPGVPPLPPSPREASEPEAITRQPETSSAAVEPVAAAAQPRAQRRVLHVALAAGAIALVLGVAAGWTIGMATAPEPPRLTRP